MEFKRTKGSWARYTSSVPSINNPTKHSVYSQCKRVALCYNLFESDSSLNIDEKESEYNALLISKAPEMLEGLKEALKFSKMKDNEVMVSYFENLIRQATEL